MPRAKKKVTKRPGRTDKISVSLDRDDLAVLRARAKRLHAGNISAAVAEGVQRLRQEEARLAVVAWLGDAGKGTPEEHEAIRAELRGDVPPPRRRRGAA